MRPIWPAAAAAAIMLAAPASAQSSPYDRGVAARLAGDNARAVALLEQAVAAEPGNADAHLQLGLALLNLGRLDEAERSLKRTLELAPEYQDAKDALVRLAEQKGAARSAAHRWQLDVDGSYSALSQGAPDWHEGTVRLAGQIDPATTISGAVQFARRFGLTDTYGELRIDRRLSARASGWIALGGTPDADFRPEWQVAGGISTRVTDGPYATVLTIDASQARYPLEDISSINPGIEQYVGGGSWLTARMINVFEAGQHHAGGLARVDWMASPKLRLFAGGAYAPDALQGVVTRVTSEFAGISADVSQRLTLRFSVTHEDRGNGPDRLELSAGMGVRF